VTFPDGTTLPVRRKQVKQVKRIRDRLDASSRAAFIAGAFALLTHSDVSEATIARGVGGG
jgi:hypothetical protein